MKNSITIMLVSVLLAISGAATAQQQLPCRDEIQLNWNAPTTRTDGSALPLTDIQGYELVVTTATESNSVTINAATTTEFTHENPVPDCGAGDIDYQIATVDTDGRVSELTDPTIVTVAGGRITVDDPLPSTTVIDFSEVRQRPDQGHPACTQILQYGCKR